MLIRAMVFILFVFIISGCSTGPKKQTAQQGEYQIPPQVYQQKTSTWDYEEAQPVKTKTYSTLEKLSGTQIQKALKNAGFYQGSIDGKIGSKTKEAIIKFQKVNGLKADGIVGKRTSAELSRYLSQ